MIGLPKHKMIGQPFMAFCAPESLEMAQWMFEKKMQDKQDETRYELSVIDVAGNKHTLEVDTRAVMEQGQFIGVYGIARDISERKKHESQLQRLLSIIDTSSDFVGMANADGRVMYVNPAGRRMVGLSVDDDVSQMTLAEFHTQVEIERMHNEIFPQIMKHGGYQTSIHFLARDGEKIPTLATFSMQQYKDGSPPTFSIIARDVRKEQAEQRRLEHVQRLESLGVLAGGIAHDFNNILTAILGNAAMAERKAQMNQWMDMPKYLSNIVASSEKATELCKQMLAYSGKGQFVIKPLSLSRMVSEIASLLEVSIGKNIVLNYQLMDSLPMVDADAAQMQQVIMNLVINASDAIGGNSGEIFLSTGVIQADRTYLSRTCLHDKLPAGDYVFLKVSDTGCGMDTQTQQKIFEPFFTTKETGHGLGMSAVLGIVQGHHGALLLHSKPKQGTTFKLLLPVSSQPVEASLPTMDMHQPSKGSGKILIVDDEESIRERRNGWRCSLSATPT